MSRANLGHSSHVGSSEWGKAKGKSCSGPDAFFHRRLDPPGLARQGRLPSSPRTAAMADAAEPKPIPPTIDVVVVDPHHAPVQYVDWIITGGHGPSQGTVNVVLAA